MNNKLVTVCIPLFNNESTIAETLDSIIGQTYKYIKIKVFDNASTDNSYNIICDYASKFHQIEIVRNETNVGAEENFTKCIQAAEGEYTAIFHADDIYLNTIIEEQVAFLNHHHDVMAVSTHAYVIDTFNNLRGNQLLPQEFSNNIYHKMSMEELFYLTLKYGNIITCPSVMGRTTIYNSIIKEWRGYLFNTAADLDVWLRFAQVGKFGFITKPLMKYRLSEASYSYRMESKCMRVNILDLFKVLDYYIEKKIVTLSKYEQYLYDSLLYLDVLNININRFINNIYVYDKTPLLKFTFTKRIIKYKVVNTLFNLIKHIYIPISLKEYIRYLKGSRK